MNVTKKISLLVSNSSTYNVGKLQAKAYSILNRRTTEALVDYKISPKEWALLGILYEQESLRPKDAADELGVEAAYITSMASHLKEIKLLDEEGDKVDTRAKILRLTTAGKSFVKKTEPILRAHMRPLLKEVEPRDIVGYLVVLEHIIKNDSN